MNKKIEVKKVIKTIKITENDQEVLNSIRLKMIEELDFLEECSASNFCCKDCEPSKKYKKYYSQYTKFKTLYNKLYS